MDHPLFVFEKRPSIINIKSRADALNMPEDGLLRPVGSVLRIEQGGRGPSSKKGSYIRGFYK